MDPVDADVAAYIRRWRPWPVSPGAAAFARGVIAKTAPEGRERAKNLLRAAGKLAGYALGLGLDLVPEVVFHPSVIERFARAAPGLSGVARRTLRTNQRFIGRRRVSLGDILAAFTVGWRIDSIEPATIDTNVHPTGVRGWLAALTRTCEDAPC